MQSITYDDALEKVGYGRFQRRLLLVCGLGWAADAMEVLLVSFALPAMAAEWSLSPVQKSLLATAIFIGMLVGAVVWGRLCDRVGRRIGFVLTIAFYSLFGFLSAFAPSFIWFIVLRMLTGFGVGGALPVDYGMFSEYLPTKNRGRRLVYLEAFWALGTVFAAGLAWLIVPRFGWRGLFAFSALPGFLLFAVRNGVPESPRYLFAKGRKAEARTVLERVASVNGTSLPEGELVLHSDAGAPQLNERPAGPRSSRWADLFAPRLRRTTVLLWLVWFLISIGYYGAFTWLPSWFHSKGFSLPASIPTPSSWPSRRYPATFLRPGSSSDGAVARPWAHTSSRAASSPGFSSSRPRPSP